MATMNENFFAELLSPKAAKWSAGVAFDRSNGLPLDQWSVFQTKDDAEDYLSNSKAYPGQVIAYAEDDGSMTACVLSQNAEGTALTLKPIGIIPSGDAKTIEVTADGQISIYGFGDATTGYLPRKAEDGTLEWVPISAVVQGDGNKITTLTSEDGSVTITTKTDTDTSLVYDLSVVHPDMPEYAVVKDTRAEGATETTYHLTKDGENVDVAIVVPDAYNDTALAGRVTDLENNKADKSNTYTKTEVDSAISTAVEGILGEDVKEAYDTLKEIQDILEGTDGEKIDGLIETVDDNKEKIETLTGDATVAGSVDAKIAAAVEDVKDYTDEKTIGYIVSDDSDPDNEGIKNVTIDAGRISLNGSNNTTGSINLNADHIGITGTSFEITIPSHGQATLNKDPIATKGYVDGALQAKVNVNDYNTDKASFALSANVVSNDTFDQFKEDNTEVINNAVNTINTEVAKKLEKVTIAHTSENVTEGVTYSEDGKTANIVVDSYLKSETYTKGETDTAITNKIKEFTGGESAADVLLALNDYKKANDTEIYGATKVAEWTDDEGKYNPDYTKDSRIDANDAAIKVNAEAINNIAVLVGSSGDYVEGGEVKNTLAYKIGALEAHDAAHSVEYGVLSGKVDQNIIDIAKKADKENTYTKGEVEGLLVPYALAANVYTTTEADGKFLAKADYTPYDDTAVKKLISDEADRADKEEKRIAKLVADNTTAIEVIYKAGEGEAKATGLLVDLEDRVDGIDALLNTVSSEDNITSLKELAIWVEEHETEVLPVIEQLGKDLDALELSVAAIIQPKESEEISVAADGTLGVKEIGVDKLVNVEGFELILNGGNANLTA